MKIPLISALALSASLCGAPLAAVAQGPISPASPSYTQANSFARQSAPAATPPVAAVPRSPFDGIPGAYPVAQPAYGYARSEPIDPNHKLQPGDQLSYQVAEDREPDKTATLPVLDTGEVNVPLIGRVRATGKSTGQLSSDIKSALEREYYYHATVLLGLNTVALRVSPGKVFVKGAVRTNTAVDLPVDGQLTASQAVTQAGGLVDFSDPKHTKVLRKGGPPKGILVDLKKVESGALDQDIVLQPGDTVQVPEARLKIQL